MKNPRVNGNPHATMPAQAGATQSGVGDPVLGPLPHAVGEQDELRRTLAASQAASDAARRTTDVLTDTVSSLRQEVIRLERELAQVRHFAYHDELTGLPNRSLLLDRLNQALVHAGRQRKQVGLLLLDLDGFKGINDRLGHATGDTLLQRVAQRLLSCLRGGDTACRYGGDEFVILLPEVDSEKSAAEVAQKLHANLAEPYVVGDHSIAVTASIGIAVYPFDGSNQEELIRRADIAMYLAKARSNASIPRQAAARN